MLQRTRRARQSVAPYTPSTAECCSVHAEHGRVLQRTRRAPGRVLHHTRRAPGSAALTWRRSQSLAVDMTHIPVLDQASGQCLCISAKSFHQEYEVRGYGGTVAIVGVSLNLCGRCTGNSGVSWVGARLRHCEEASTIPRKKMVESIVAFLACFTQKQFVPLQVQKFHYWHKKPARCLRQHKKRAISPQ